MRRLVAAAVMSFCASTIASAQTPPAQQPGNAAPGKVVAPTEALPTQGTASAAVPVPGQVEVHFAAGSAEISSSERANVGRLASLCAQGQASVIAIAGYPDAAEDPKKAVQLSLRRANAVMSALLVRGDVAKFGWDISGMAMPGQQASQNRKAVGTCK